MGVKPARAWKETCLSHSRYPIFVNRKGGETWTHPTLPRNHRLCSPCCRRICTSSCEMQEHCHDPTHLPWDPLKNTLVEIQGGSNAFGDNPISTEKEWLSHAFALYLAPPLFAESSRAQRIMIPASDGWNVVKPTSGQKLFGRNRKSVTLPGLQTTCGDSRRLGCQFSNCTSWVCEMSQKFLHFKFIDYPPWMGVCSLLKHYKTLWVLLNLLVCHHVHSFLPLELP